MIPLDVVIPLAGPDFELENGSTKAEILVDGQPLLLRAITSRSWWRREEVSSTDLVFVLRDSERCRRFAHERLEDWFPGCRVAFLSRGTQGAALSALAGIALCDPEALLCVDLADIFYEENFCPAATFSEEPQLGGMVPVFASDWPMYSYAEVAADGRVIRTAEKRVISDIASAGTYFFRNAAVYLQAIAHAIRDKENQTYNGLYFLCPLFNGVIASGLDVRTCPVGQIVDIKKEFL